MFTDDVDVDLFTPASSTSLASIFKVSQTENKEDTASLKYKPEQPPSQTKVEDKSEDAKPTECVFACASNVYEWTNNTYVNKGILGFGIIKILKNGTHNFVLYNANKTTLSYATFSPTFEVHVKKLCFSYYDNARKYWNIYAKENEIEKIVEILKQLNIMIKQSEQENPPTNVSSSFENQDVESTKEKSMEDKSDTDSSVNKRTKDSIIKRMASMGHSVLPYTKANFESTDSSDSNESIDHRRPTKQKPIKSSQSIPHKNIASNIQEELDGQVFTTKSVAKTKTQHGANSNVHENPNEVVPCSSLEVVSNRKPEMPVVGMSDVSLLISEQRVSNSELRINMNRISDKLDMVIGKINETSNSDREYSGSNYQNIIIQKLLNEYETKIKNYEEYIQANGLGSKLIKNNKGDDIGQTKIVEASEENDSEILHLKNEIIKLNQQCDTFAQKEKSYLHEIANLKKEIEHKDEQLLLNLNKKIEDTSSNFQKSDDAKNEIKSLMNETFQTIAANFTNEERYSGSKVKSVVAAVIKKTTIDSISNL
ncbi:FK506-binding protein 15-like [Aricia agestis]|uniref:FK506-binding protein 15-like n=1 Tax=Aricia agestis TaxID=91739 RepID=UPI001C2022AC|nr:FK506-binding protein 15-like [Aricia agestis]